MNKIVYATSTESAQYAANRAKTPASMQAVAAAAAKAAAAKAAAVKGDDK